MPVIGQAFSPGILQLLVQKGENVADRNLQAAIAERQLKESAAERGLKRDIAQAQLGLEATQGDDQSKFAIESMKEQGRNARAAETNALNQALAAQREGRLAPESEAKIAYYDARTGAVELKTPEEIKALQAGTALTSAKTGGQVLQNKVTETQLAKARVELNEMQLSGPERLRRIKLMNDYWAEKTGELGARLDLAQSSQDFEQAMRIQDQGRKDAAMYMAYMKLMTAVDLFGKTVPERAGLNPQMVQLALAGAQDQIRAYLRVLAKESPAAYQKATADLLQQEKAASQASGPVPTSFSGAVDAANAPVDVDPLSVLESQTGVPMR